VSSGKDTTNFDPYEEGLCMALKQDFVGKFKEF
jgi:hypothetical protein